MTNEYLKRFNSELKKGPTFFRRVGEVSDKILENKHTNGLINFLDNHKYQIALAGGYYAALIGAEIAFNQVLGHPYVGSIIRNEHRIPEGTTLFPPRLNVGSGPHNVNITRHLTPVETTFVEAYKNPASHIAAVAAPPIAIAAKKGVDYRKK